MSSTRPSVANITNMETLLAARQQEGLVVAPSEPEQDKISFIFNNLSVLNLGVKGEDLKEILNVEENEGHTKWLAYYFVIKRASIEPNFHNLYSLFLGTLKSEKLYENVIKETYKNIGFLLRSDKTSGNFSDRSLLKNLGHWLGLMVLARNKPILQVDLDMKQLIIEAYQSAGVALRCSLRYQSAGVRLQEQSVQASLPLDPGPHEPPGRAPRQARPEAQSEVRD